MKVFCNKLDIDLFYGLSAPEGGGRCRGVKRGMKGVIRLFTLREISWVVSFVADL